MSEYDRQVDAYWTQEANRAYLERKLEVRTELAENDGKVMPWMFYAIGTSHLAELLARYPSPDISAIQPLDQFGFFAKAMANQPRPLPLVA
jgi:hypothetical protein